MAEHQGLIIRVVEDDVRLAQVLSRVLNRWGYEVEWAASMTGAVRGFERAPDMALLDFHLPDGNGLDLAGTLRALYPNLPLLLMTGCPFRLRGRPECARYFRQVLSKPLELQQLREALSAAWSEDEYADDHAPCSC